MPLKMVICYTKYKIQQFKNNNNEIKDQQS